MIPYTFIEVERAAVKEFIETHHYSHNINGVISDYCFAIYNDHQMVGACIFGRIAMANVWKKYVTSPFDLIELRRLVCINETVKNTESWFIGQCLRWLAKYTQIKLVISYADLEQGHTGIIYKASNFKFIGTTKNQRVIIFNNKQYHDKCIRTRYKGQLKPFAVKIKAALDAGQAQYKLVKGKNIYLYSLTPRLKDSP